MTKLAQLSYRLQVILLAGVAASALATALLAGGEALARHVPVKAVRDNITRRSEEDPGSNP